MHAHLTTRREVLAALGTASATRLPSATRRACRATGVLALAAIRLGAQQPASAPISAVRYKVTADKAALVEHHLKVTMSFDVSDASVVLLSLPAWTPGACEITNFARWVRGLRAGNGCRGELHDGQGGEHAA